MRLRGNGPGIVLLVLTALLLGAIVGPEPARGATKPNVILIVTDDMRWDEMAYMPTVQQQIVGKGVNFTNAMVVNSWCCPSRVTILTGKPSHATGVYTNSYPNGGYYSFRPPKDSSTLAVWLRNAGYRTGLFGKYLNGYTSTSIPPGWNRWVAFNSSSTASSGGAYYNYRLNRDGVNRSYGSTASEYSTDVLASDALQFIRSTPSDQPFFLMFTPFALHGTPIQAPRHRGRYSRLTFPRPPSWYEPDVSDKPAWVRGLSPTAPSWLDGNRRYSLETLLAVDEAISSMISELSSAGRLANTMIIFMSDNGHNRGEHRWFGKETAYEEAVRIPLAIRFDAAGTAQRTDPRLVLNMDIAQTVSEAAGVNAPGAEGASLLPLVYGNAPQTWRSEFLIEHLNPGGTDPVPTYCAVRTETHKYVQYKTGEEELYDLRSDPYELVNRAGDPASGPVLQALRPRLVQLCQPPPAGFTPAG